jgi:hypothetical protein
MKVCRPSQLSLRYRCVSARGWAVCTQPMIDSSSQRFARHSVLYVWKSRSRVQLEPVASGVLFSTWHGCTASAVTVEESARGDQPLVGAAQTAWCELPQSDPGLADGWSSPRHGLFRRVYIDSACQHSCSMGSI